MNIKKIDLLLLIYLYVDYIGNVDKVIVIYKLKEIWMDGLIFFSSIYEKVIDVVLVLDVKYKELRCGEKVIFGLFNLEVLSFDKLENDVNNDFIVVKIIYKDIFVIFIGDVEKGWEREMVDSGVDLEVDILDLGYYGLFIFN